MHTYSESSTQKMNDTLLQKVDKFKDLRVIFDQSLLFDSHISEKKSHNVGDYKKKF